MEKRNFVFEKFDFDFFLRCCSSVIYVFRKNWIINIMYWWQTNDKYFIFWMMMITQIAFCVIVESFFFLLSLHALSIEFCFVLFFRFDFWFLCYQQQQQQQSSSHHHPHHKHIIITTITHIIIGHDMIVWFEFELTNIQLSSSIIMNNFAIWCVKPNTSVVVFLGTDFWFLIQNRNLDWSPLSKYFWSKQKKIGQIFFLEENMHNPLIFFSK